MVLHEPNEHFSAKALYDLALIKRAVENDDQQAYAELMLRYRDTVFFMLLKMIGSKDDAEDLTIEAFGKAFSKLEQYTSSYAFSTWLFKIATNNCIDFIRKKRGITISIDNPNTDSEGNDFFRELNCPNDDPEDILIRKQKANIAREAIQKLRPSFRQLLEMRYFQELSYEEISTKTQLPLGTVKAQLYRAKEALSHILKNTQNHL